MLPHGSKKNVFPPFGNTPPIRGRVIVIARTDKNEKGELLNFDGISPFLLNKLITKYCGDVKSAKMLKNGSLLVESSCEEQAEKLIKLRKLENQLNVSTVEHDTLNISKCVFNCYELKHTATEVILKEFQKTDGKFMKIQRFTKTKNGEKVKTNTFLITYKGPNPPTEVKVGFNLIKTRSFYPSPLRCYNCLNFGHLAKNCKRVKVCAKCSKPFHDGSCGNEIKCAVCEKAHHTLSDKCEQKIEQLLIVKTKVDNNLDYHQAKLKLENSMKAEYAEAVKKNKVQNMDENYKQQIEDIKNAVHSLQKDYEKFKISTQSHKDDLNQKIQNLQKENEKLKTTIQQLKIADKQQEIPSDKENNKNNNISSQSSSEARSNAENSEGFSIFLSKKTRKYRKRQLMAETESEYFKKRSEETTMKKSELKSVTGSHELQIPQLKHEMKKQQLNEGPFEQLETCKKWLVNLRKEIEAYKNANSTSDEDE